MTILITPTDDIVGPIVHQLATVLSNQIVGIGRMYEEVPDGPPEDNSVLFPVTKFKAEGDTAGKEYLRITFGIRYLVRHSTFQENMLACYAYFSAIFRVLSAWINQSLTDTNNIDHAISVTPKEGGFTQFTVAGQAFVGMVINTEVLTEINTINS